MARQMYKRLKTWFYSGPADLGLRLRGRRGYQSPTVTAAAWILAFIARHLTLPGRFTAICCLLLLPYSLVTTAMPIYLLSFAVALLLLVDFLAGLLMLPKMEIARSFPARVAEGAELTVVYRIGNLRRRSIWNLQVDTLFFPRAVQVLEPPRAITRVRGDGRVALTACWLAKRRGEHAVPAARAVAAFPFGLWSWGVTPGKADKLLVYPRFKPLTAVNLAIGERYQPEGASVSSKAGMSMEFLGCRQFRDGDDLKRLHMRSWARTGYPVVKEFRQEYMARTGIVVDTCLPRRLFEEVRMRFQPRAEFEATVSLAAALVDFFAGHDSRVDLFAAGGQIHHFGGSHGIDYLNHVLDILATLNYTTHDDFADLGGKLSPYLRQTSGIVFILGGWNQTRRQVVEDVANTGLLCRVVLVAAPRRRPGNLPGYVYAVDPKAVVEGRCTAL